MKHRRMAVFVFVGISLIASVAVCGVWLLGHQGAFESQAWRTGNERVRQAMLKDLIHSRILDGLPADKVLQLLGPPGSGSPAPIAGKETLWTYHNVRIERMPPNAYHLYIVFSGDPPRVTSYFQDD